jgi:hypothetical protein
MIHRSKVFFPILAVLFVSGALGVALAVQDDAQPMPAEAGDLAQAASIEVRDAGGQVVLSGRFGAGDADDDDGGVERKAELAASSGSAKGEAEIEISGEAGAPAQELEVEVEGLQAGATFTVQLDGRPLATLTTDDRGRADATFTSQAAK